MNKKLTKNVVIVFLFVITICTNVNAAITKQQSQDLAEYAKKFIEEGNARRDEKGYPLLTYALSGNWNTCVEIRNSGYNEQLYYIKRNGYHIYKGKYVELGNKWCMDCGTYVSYMLKKTLGLELYNGREPWHVQDMYNDALRGKNSKYLEFVYKSVAVGRIDYSKLQSGDIIARITANGNHGMLYVGDGMIAHANRDMITYKTPAVFGFQVSKLNQYYMPGTVVRIMRIKDGIIPEDLVVNTTITWPDTGETVDLLGRTINTDEISGDELEIENNSGDNIKTENDSGDNIKTEIILSDNQTAEAFIDNNIEKENIEVISGEHFFEETIKLQEKKLESIRIKPLMVHVYKNNSRLFNWVK